MDDYWKNCAHKKDKSKGTMPEITGPSHAYHCYEKHDFYNFQENVQTPDLIGFEQKGSRALTRGTKDHLMLDKATMKDSRYRKTNLAMAWIDYQKAYDMVLYSWIVESLEMIGAPINFIKFFETSMAQWETKLSTRERSRQTSRSSAVYSKRTHYPH